MAQDIALVDNDLKITNGDFSIEQSDEQHVDLLCNTSAGEWKQFPTAGMGLMNYLLGEDADLTKMKHVMDVQLQADGVANKKIRLRGGKIQIDAQY